MQIDVSVIIVNWNTKDLLIQCIRSIKEKTRQICYEIIVVDNASSDDSVRKLQHEFEDVTIIALSENLGFSRANNIGIKESKGRYVVLLNSDTYLENDALSLMYDYFESNPETGLLGGQVLNLDGSLQPSAREFPSLWRNVTKIFLPIGIRRFLYGFGPRNIAGFDYASTKQVEALMGAFLMTKQQCIATVGALDERFFFYAEDIDWSKRFWDNGLPVMFFHLPRVVHYGGGSSSNAPIAYRIEMMRADLVYFAKHFNTSQYVINYLVLIIYHFFRSVVMTVFYPISRKGSRYKRNFIKREFNCFLWLIKNRFKKIETTR